jgi:phospholipid transport system substrate-binding protein
MKLLHIDSNILGEGSASRRLSAAIVAAFARAVPDLETVRRDLDADPIVKAVMASDRVDAKDVENLMRHTAARLLERDPQEKSARLARHEKPTATTNLATLVKGFVLALAVITGLSAEPHRAGAEDAPVAFIRTLGTQAVSVIRSDLPIASKATYFGQLVRQDFDVPGICRFVLGRYWRVASSSEQREFCNSLADRLIDFYGRRLVQSGGADFVVTGSRTIPDGVIVASRIIPQQGAPIAVDWRLGINDGHYKIDDVAIDGVSMALSQRSEIAALIARGGGQVGMLLATMR